jgi:membrane protease YdiL (CAAX protease family)
MKFVIRHKTFRSYFWRSALWTLGLPFGLGMGIFSALERNSWRTTGIINRQTLILFISWLIAGFLFAYFYGRSRWKGMKEYEAALKAEEGENEIQENQNK